MVIGMASEKFVEGGGAQCLSAGDVYQAAQDLVHLLRDTAGGQTIRSSRPGRPPSAPDTYA
jgi:hypothetical protein